MNPQKGIFIVSLQANEYHAFIELGSSFSYSTDLTIGHSPEPDVSISDLEILFLIRKMLMYDSNFVLPFRAWCCSTGWAHIRLSQVDDQLHMVHNKRGDTSEKSEYDWSLFIGWGVQKSGVTWCLWQQLIATFLWHLYWKRWLYLLCYGLPCHFHFSFPFWFIALNVYAIDRVQNAFNGPWSNILVLMCNINQPSLYI